MPGFAPTSSTGLWGIVGSFVAASLPTLHPFTLFFANGHSEDARRIGTLSVVDLTKRTVTATLDAKTFGANRLKFTPDGKLVLISRLGDGDLVIYDAASRKEFKRTKIGHGAAGILMDRDGNRAFISCGPDNYVAVLDLNTLEVMSHIDVGGEPDGLAWAIRR